MVHDRAIGTRSPIPGGWIPAAASAALVRVVAVLAAVVLLAAPACGRSTGPKERASSSSGAQDDLVFRGGDAAPADDAVFSTPGRFLGRAVTLEGTVGGAVDPYSFLLEGERPTDVIVVVGTTAAPHETGAKVEVAGTVQELDVSVLEEHLGVELDDDGHDRHRHRHVVLANRVDGISRRTGSRRPGP